MKMKQRLTDKQVVTLHDALITAQRIYDQIAQDATNDGRPDMAGMYLGKSDDCAELLSAAPFVDRVTVRLDYSL